MDDKFKKRKEVLMLILLKLKVKGINRSTSDFKGICGKSHRVNISPKLGQFYYRTYYKSVESENESHELVLVVGTGKGCSETKNLSLWCLKESDTNGLYCFGDGTKKEIEQYPIKNKWELV